MVHVTIDNTLKGCSMAHSYTEETVYRGMIFCASYANILVPVHTSTYVEYYTMYAENNR